ncbi:MAG: hypothetical protein ACRDQ1_05875 [Sciscionella sp.]
MPRCATSGTTDPAGRTPSWTAYRIAPDARRTDYYRTLWNTT